MSHSEAEHFLEHNPPPVVVPPVVKPEHCSVTSKRLGGAKSKFASDCAGYKRVDCDPIDGNWQCASFKIGNFAPGTSPVTPPPIVDDPVQDNSDPDPVIPPVIVPSGTNVETTLPGTYTGRNPGGVAWMDSFQRDGVCYIDSGFDHGIGNVKVDTPQGKKTVRQIAEAQNAPKRRSSDPIYNDVQCGNGPANSAGDEDPDQCPGRVDLGRSGCRTIGPKWDLK